MIHQGNVFDVLPTLPREHFHMAVTSPPYWNLRDYGVPGQLGSEPTVEEYAANLVRVFSLLRDTLRDDGALFLNLGDTYSTRRVKVPGMRDKQLVGVPWRVALAMQADGWLLRSDTIWCLSGTTVVYAKTQRGEMPVPVKDLVRLNPSTVQLWSGAKWTQVLGWNESAAEKGLELRLRNGQHLCCTAGHQWPTQRGIVRADELQPGDAIQTTVLPEPAEADVPTSIPDQFGYLVGLYLAEGSSSGKGRVRLAGDKHELEPRLAAFRWLTTSFGAFVRGYIYGNTSEVVIDSPVILAMLRLYVHGTTAKNKGLKVSVWRRPNQFLREILRGYLDGDGHYDPENNRHRLGFTRNRRLAEGLRTLCARLGLSLRLSPARVKSFGRTWPVYRGDVRLTPTNHHHNGREGGEVVSIHLDRGKKFWDIGVADEPHLFALASGILTHNSKPDPMPTSADDRPMQSKEYVFLFTKRPRYFYDCYAVRTETGAKLRDVWTISKQSYRGKHIATFPEKLAERCILLGTSEKGCCPVCGTPIQRQVKKTRMPTRPGRNNKLDETGKANRDPQRHITTVETIGWSHVCPCFPASGAVPCRVLDPFIGSGTTAVVCKRLGRECVGVELNPEYVSLIEERLAA